MLLLPLPELLFFHTFLTIETWEIFSTGGKIHGTAKNAFIPKDVVNELDLVLPGSRSCLKS